MRSWKDIREKFDDLQGKTLQTPWMLPYVDVQWKRPFPATYEKLLYFPTQELREWWNPRISITGDQGLDAHALKDEWLGTFSAAGDKIIQDHCFPLLQNNPTKSWLEAMCLTLNEHRAGESILEGVIPGTQDDGVTILHARVNNLWEKSIQMCDRLESSEIQGGTESNILWRKAKQSLVQLCFTVFELRPINKYAEPFQCDGAVGALLDAFGSYFSNQCPLNAEAWRARIRRRALLGMNCLENEISEEDYWKTGIELLHQHEALWEGLKRRFPEQVLNVSALSNGIWVDKREAVVQSFQKRIDVLAGIEARTIDSETRMARGWSSDSRTCGQVPPAPPAQQPSPAEQNIELNDTEKNILEALGKEKMKGEDLAKKAGYPFNSNFKATLSSLKKRGILGNAAPGYFLEPKHLHLLDKGQDKGQD